MFLQRLRIIFYIYMKWGFLHTCLNCVQMYGSCPFGIFINSMIRLFILKFAPFYRKWCHFRVITIQRVRNEEPLLILCGFVFI